MQLDMSMSLGCANKYKPYISFETWRLINPSSVDITDGINLVYGINSLGEWTDNGDGSYTSSLNATFLRLSMTSIGIGILRNLSLEAYGSNGELRTVLGNSTDDSTYTTMNDLWKLIDYSVLNTIGGVLYIQNDEGVSITVRNIKVQKVIQKKDVNYIKGDGKSRSRIQTDCSSYTSFNGIEQFISEPLVPNSIYPTELTFFAYLKDVVSGVVINTGYASGNGGFSLRVLSNQVQINSNSNENIFLGVDYEDGLWHAVFKNSIWSLYCNGKLKASRLWIYTTPFLFSNVQSLSIGAYRSSSQFLQGNLGNVGWMLLSMTPQQIEQQYKQPSTFLKVKKVWSVEQNKHINEISSTVVDASKVISWFPLTESRKYAYDVKSLSLGIELDGNSNIYTSTFRKRVGQFNLGLKLEAGKKYLVVIDYDDTLNSILSGYRCYMSNGSYIEDVLITPVAGTIGTMVAIINVPDEYVPTNSTSAYAWLSTNTISTLTVDITLRSLKELTGAFKKEGYTPTQLITKQSIGLPTYNLELAEDGRVIGYKSGYSSDGTNYFISNLRDTDLGSKWKIGFVIKRPTVLEDRFLIRTALDGKGFQLDFNRTFSSGSIRMYLKDGTNTEYISVGVPNEYAFVLIDYDGINATMTKNNGSPSSKTIDFMPSGELMFKNSGSTNMKGNLRLLHVVPEQDYDKYDNAKMYEKIVKKGLLL